MLVTNRHHLHVFNECRSAKMAPWPGAAAEVEKFQKKSKGGRVNTIFARVVLVLVLIIFIILILLIIVLVLLLIVLIILILLIVVLLRLLSAFVLLLLLLLLWCCTSDSRYFYKSHILQSTENLARHHLQWRESRILPTQKGH